MHIEKILIVNTGEGEEGAEEHKRHTIVNVFMCFVSAKATTSSSYTSQLQTTISPGAIENEIVSKCALLRAICDIVFH